MDTTASVSANAHFNRQYQTHLKHLKLKGLQPKTIDAYAHAIRRIGDYFAHDIDTLSESQLTDYFSDLIATHSWSAVKLDLYGLKFFTLHVLRKPWVMPHFIKPPKAARLPDIVTVEEAQKLFATTRTLSYRVFYFTLYSLGLRLSEGLALKVGDIDGARGRVHIRDSKGRGAAFLWLLLQHVLPKGFRRARNFGFLHPNSKRLIALLHLVLKMAVSPVQAWVKPRATLRCPCCGEAMQIVRRRMCPAVPGRAPDKTLAGLAML